MDDFSENTQKNKLRLDEIACEVEENSVDTDQLINLLEEAVEIGMKVCEQAQKNISEANAQEAKAEDDGN